MPNNQQPNPPKQRKKQELTPEQKERKRQIKNLRERERNISRNSGLTSIKIDVSNLTTEEIYELRGEKLLEKAVFVDPETGEIVDTPSSKDNLNLEIIHAISNLLSHFDSSKLTRPYPAYEKHKRDIYDYLSSYWKSVLEEEGAYEVAYRLEENAMRFHNLTESLIYASMSIENESINMSTWHSLLFGGALDAITSSHIADKLEAAGLSYLAFML